MKLGLIADLHGNSTALAAVLKAGREAAVERWICAGDYVDYYYDAEGVFSLLDTVDWIGVRGNHDDRLCALVAGKIDDSAARKYGSALIIARKTLSSQRLRTLAELPERRLCQIDGRSVLVCHGSPWDAGLYVYPDAAAQIVDRLFSGDEDLILMGHTHYPAVWRQQTALAVNPGSVGQPRDRKPGACWALWNTRTHTVEMRREKYDMTKEIEECRKHDPALPYLVDVLTRTE